MYRKLSYFFLGKNQDYNHKNIWKSSLEYGKDFADMQRKQLCKQTTKHGLFWCKIT